MRLRADQRLFLSYLFLIGAVIAALSLGADYILRRHLTALVEHDLRRELYLGRALYDASPQLPPDSLADLLGRLGGRRVTIVARDGAVRGDSEVRSDALGALENHAQRPEIRAALNGDLGRDFRVSSSVGTQHLYLAAPTSRGEVIRFAVPVGQINAPLVGLQRAIAGIGAVALLLAALFSLGFSFAVTRPLRRMSAAARAMAAGDLSQRVAERRSDELGELAESLDTLAAELQRRLGQLEAERTETQMLIDSMSEGVIALAPNGSVRRANPAARRMFSLSRDPQGQTPAAVARRPEFLRLVERVLGGQPIPPTELTHHGRALLVTAHPLPGGGAVLVFLDVTTLRRLESVRRDFVANASHELKTPLTAIRGSSETLLDEELPPEMRRRFAEMVSTNAQRLQRIVDDLLDLSRIESGGWQVEPELLSLAAAARDAWSSCSAAAEQRQIRFAIELPTGCERVHADPSALRQIFGNLFSNSLRYTPAGGEIGVRARCAAGTEQPPALAARSLQADLTESLPGSAGWIEIEVYDTGSGIPASHLPRIFERFYRVDPARSRAEGGTGLGLAIVRHLVEGHGGRITAESQLGVGTVIRFTVPAAPAWLT
ncbi:MAG: HAMP domain-containing protein [Gemmatimonadetes bacterium]|nr:HAMP domain-containing protein [Gemmatimonadota bacterium]